MWTRFMDMYSGGQRKLDWAYIFIEAPEAEAKVIFYNRFGRNPGRVTCTCCGEDYSVSECENLQEATAYDRGCHYVYLDSKGKEVDRKTAMKIDGCTGRYMERKDPRGYRDYMTVDEYIKTDDVLVIGSDDIQSNERYGTVPDEGYVWAGG